MSNLTKLMNEKSLDTFEKLTEYLSFPPYCIEVREDRPVSNLFLLHYTDMSEIGNKVVEECNGLVMDKNILKIVGYGMNRVYTEQEMPHDLDWNSGEFYNCIDGTMIKVYYYNCKWQISTNKCINGEKSKWDADSSFSELFRECDVNFELLDKNKCYSYVLTHPENRIVIPYSKTSAFLVAERNMETFELSEYFISSKKFSDSNKYHSAKTSIFLEGSFLVKFEDKIVRLDSQEFEFVKSLKNNSRDLISRYIDFLGDENGKNAMKYYFFEYTEEFERVDNDLIHLTRIIMNLYKKIYMFREQITIFPKYKQLLGQIHGEFRKTKIKRNEENIYNKIISLPPHVIKWILYDAK